MIPLIIGFAASGIGALGIAKGKEGLDKIERAKKRAEFAQKRHQDSIDCLNEQWEKTNHLSSLYEKLRLRVGLKVINRFVEFIQRNGRKASCSEQRLLEELEGISLQDLREFKSFAFDAE